jgi:hypothetical protein
MNVDHCCFHILVAQQFLNGANIVTILQQMRRKAMAKLMTTHPLLQTGTRSLNSLLSATLR